MQVYTRRPALVMEADTGLRIRPCRRMIPIFIGTGLPARAAGNALIFSTRRRYHLR